MLTDLTLHELASNGDVKQIEACVKLGKTESINEQDEEYGFRMPLHIAAQIGHLRCCKYLLEGGADPAARMTMAWTPAHCAAEGGHLSVLQLLVDVGGPVNSKDDYGDTPALIAKRYGHTECVEFLRSVEELPEQKIEMVQRASDTPMRDSKESSKVTMVD